MTGSIVSAATFTSPTELDCDVCIVGSGAGGSVLAAGLVEQGLDVVMLEAGSHYTRKDFKGNQPWAFDNMYQERGARATEDLAITVLQGRSVGGSTTINWSTCYRTPDRIFAHWADVHGVKDVSPSMMAPHFDAVERRLNIKEWPVDRANGNNRVLLRGGEKLGWHPHALKRNVRGCMNSGYCGEGCPVDAKQGMAVSYLDDAVRGGLRIVCNCEVERFEWSERKAQAVHGVAVDPDSDHSLGIPVTVRAKVFVNSGGAINGPALFLRSGIEGNGLIGKRTFVHPVSGVSGLYDEHIGPWAGAPQSIGCHHFNDRGPEKMGFFLEAAPLQPMLASTVGFLFGGAHSEFMRKLGNVGVTIALGIDGILPQDVGGTVLLKSDGRVWLRYPIEAHLTECLAAAHKEMARCHFAAGAKQVATLHAEAIVMNSEAELSKLDSAPYGAHEQSLFTAHVMGGCAMGGEAGTSVVNSDLQMWDFDNLFVVDGSVLPTSLGVNPSETIYALAHRARERVAAAV
ncbi:MAG: GMC family oxidoreductase [Deltaproteobacteria bacterium]|nr:GMC family oxidoreductase [Deltaproteobacteria bacterium]